MIWLSSLSPPTWQSVCLSSASTGKLEPRQTQSAWPISRFLWVKGVAPAPQVLFDVCVYIYTLNRLYLTDSESGKEEYGGNPLSGFCSL